jgi:hypothetical protein
MTEKDKLYKTIRYLLIIAFVSFIIMLLLMLVLFFSDSGNMGDIITDVVTKSVNDTTSINK